MKIGKVADFGRTSEMREMYPNNPYKKINKM